jgi:hypothetical protein
LTQNNELQNQLNVLESQVREYENQTSVLQNQVNELKQQNLELQNQTIELESLIDRFTNRVNITDFSSSGFSPMVGLLVESLANVTIQNFGINDVENLTLRLAGEDAEQFSKEINIKIIRAGETLTVSAYYYWYIGSTSPAKVTLMLSETILDEYRSH